MTQQLALATSTALPPRERRAYDGLVAALERSHRRHAHILQHGAGDPFWHDGTGLMLVRSHILSYRREISGFCDQHLLPLPAVMARPVPRRYPLDRCVQCYPNHARVG